MLKKKIKLLIIAVTVLFSAPSFAAKIILPSIEEPVTARENFYNCFNHFSIRFGFFSCRDLVNIPIALLPGVILSEGQYLALREEFYLLQTLLPNGVQF